MHFCYRRTIWLKQENFSCNNKTNYARRHKFITHKNNCCQVFSRSCSDQPLFVNEYNFKVRWKSSSLKNKFPGFRREKHKHLFSQSKPYSTTSYEHVSILTLGGLWTNKLGKFSFSVLQQEFSFKAQAAQTLWEFVGLWIYKKKHENRQNRNRNDLLSLRL